MPYQGECLCGAVAFELQGEPFLYVICHCKNCKQAGGGAFMANAFFEPQYVTVTKGKDSVKTYSDNKTKSGNAVFRSFCSNCGSPLFIGPAAGNITVVQASNVNGSENWVPKKEFFAECKWGWVKELTFQPKKSKL
ncbi:hypothetical protein H1R20_g12374, partial [Candolleomyces eurysporus]